MHIVEQGLLSSIEDIGRLKIMDFSRCNGLWQDNPVRAMNTAKNWMVGTMSYTILQIDMSKYPQRNDWPGWNHVGSHEHLGKMYWNCFFANDDGNGTLKFSDSPDFEGTLLDEGIERKFYGDIGQVSASTFIIEVLPRMHKGDLWISIPNERTQIILECLVDLDSIIGDKLEEMCGI